MSGEGAVERFGEGLFTARNVGAEDILGVGDGVGGVPGGEDPAGCVKNLRVQGGGGGRGRCGLSEIGIGSGGEGVRDLVGRGGSVCGGGPCHAM